MRNSSKLPFEQGDPQTLALEYERLRAQALADRGSRGRALGLLVFVAKGMSAWMEQVLCVAQSPSDQGGPPAAKGAVVHEVSSVVPDGLIDVLAEIVSGHIQPGSNHGNAHKIEA